MVSVKSQTSDPAMNAGIPPDWLGKQFWRRKCHVTTAVGLQDPPSELTRTDCSEQCRHRQSSPWDRSELRTQGQE